MSYTSLTSVQALIDRGIKPDAGTARLCGCDLAELEGRELRLARREAAVVFQQIGF